MFTLSEYQTMACTNTPVADSLLATLEAQRAPEAKGLSLEDALDITEVLAQASTFDNGSTKVITGLHPSLGAVHVIFPAIGECILLA